jgi:hypothetical protein
VQRGRVEELLPAPQEDSVLFTPQSTFTRPVGQAIQAAVVQTAEHGAARWRTQGASNRSVLPLWKLQTVGTERLDFLYDNLSQNDAIDMNGGSRIRVDFDYER